MLVKNYLSLIKFSHTVFALPFAVVGFLLGISATGNQFNLNLFGLVLLCMVFARSAAMAFNRYADRKIDGKNSRTKIREIPVGLISANAALTFTAISSALFITTTYFINEICLFLSPVALLVVLGYSYTKRFTSFCHLVLGIGLSLAPIGAYLAVTGEFAFLPVFFSLAVLCWVSGFDIIYALQDDEFDIEHQLHSIPARVGRKNALLASTLLHLFSAVFIVIPAIYANMGVFYWIGTLVFISMLVYQHLLVKPQDLTKVNMAFFTTNGIASVIFAVFFIMDFLLKA